MLWLWNWMVFFSSWFFMPCDVVLCYNLILRKLLSQGSQGTGWACCFCNFCIGVLRVIVHNSHYSACLALESLLLLPFVQMVVTSMDIGVHILCTPIDINIWAETPCVHKQNNVSFGVVFAGDYRSLTGKFMSHLILNFRSL